MRKNTLWKILHTKIYKNLVKISTNFVIFSNFISKGRPISELWKWLKSTLQKNAKNGRFSLIFEGPKTTNSQFSLIFSIFWPFLAQFWHVHYRFERDFWQSALFRWYFRWKYSFLGVAPMKTAQLTRFFTWKSTILGHFRAFSGSSPSKGPPRLGIWAVLEV